MDSNMIFNMTWNLTSWYDIKWKVSITEGQSFQKSIGQSYLMKYDESKIYETGKNLIYIRQIGIDFLIFGKLYRNSYINVNSTYSTYNMITLKELGEILNFTKYK